MPGSEAILEQTARDAYIKHWSSIASDKDAFVKEHGAKSASEYSFLEAKVAEELHRKVDTLLCVIKDTLRPATIDGFIGWVIGLVEGGGGAGPGPVPADAQAMQNLFSNVLIAMEKLLKRSEILAAFVKELRQGLFVFGSGSVKVECAPAAYSQAAHSLLVGIARNLDDLLPKMDHATITALEQLVGGLSVLTVQPDWILNNRKCIGSETLKVAAIGPQYPIGNDQYANLLHLLAAALADGLARLDRLFGQPAGDPNYVPDLMDVSRSHDHGHLRRRIEVHFIQRVLGPSHLVDPRYVDGNGYRNDEGRAAAEGQVKASLTIVRDTMKRIREKDGSSFHTDARTLQDNESLLRGDLQFSDLLLFRPDGQSSGREIVNEPSLLFSYLLDIHNALKEWRKLRR